MARKESCNESKSDGISEDADIDDDTVDADESEAVDGEEQQDDDEDDADSAVSVEQSGPPVGLYLKDNMVSVLSTFISCPGKNEVFCAEAFHTISGLSTAPSASRMTRILLVALSVAGRRAKQPTGAPNASHHGGKNSNCRRYVQNEGDISRWCGRITARDQPGTPDILVIFPLVSIHNSP